MLNAIGLQNIGVDAFIATKLPALRHAGPAVIANCWGNTPDEFAEVAARLAEADGVTAVEVNISCPNKREWGRIFAADLDATRAVVRAVRARCRLPLWVKLSPNVTDVTDFARAAEDEGADALCLINTVVGMAIDLERRRPALTNVTGGLSGPAIKPIALRMVHDVVRAVRVPVIGIGGISSGADALEFLLVGARAVQVGTASFVDPAATSRIARELADGLRARGCADVNDWIGTLEAI
jgi:dihydroorotate dehydrogenase (NAD+) catalytic subunit